MDLDPCLEFPSQYSSMGQLRFDSKLSHNLFVLTLQNDILVKVIQNLSQDDIDSYLVLKMKNDAVKKVHAILQKTSKLRNGDKIAFIAKCLLLEVTYQVMDSVSITDSELAVSEIDKINHFHLKVL